MAGWRGYGDAVDAEDAKDAGARGGTDGAGLQQRALQESQSVGMGRQLPCNGLGMEDLTKRQRKTPGSGHRPDFELRMARTPEDLLRAQRLRYEVFVQELGADGPLVDHAAGLERDEFDPFFDHLLLIDRAREGAPVVGVYRVMRDDQAAACGRFYSEGEYDLAPLKQSGRRLLELGRSCVHRDYRGGTAMRRLWNGLADYVLGHEIEILFGVASFHGTDIGALKLPLAYLYHHHLAPPALRVRVLDEVYQPMDLLAAGEIDPRAALRAVPPLIQAYLRLGGFVGDGAFIDRAFNTTDVCLIMDTEAMSQRHKAQYIRERSRGR